MSNLNKADLIKRVKDGSNGLTNTDAANAVEAVLIAIRDTLRDNGKVSIHGFGTFSTKERAARKGRNPATGAEIDIAASTSVKFKPVANFI